MKWADEILGDLSKILVTKYLGCTYAAGIEEVTGGDETEDGEKLNYGCTITVRVMR